MTLAKYKKMIFGLLIGTYCVLCAMVLIGIIRLTPDPLPQISEITLDDSAGMLTFRGQHLDQRLDAVLVPTYDEDKAIITKRNTWGDAYDIRINNGIGWVSNNTKGLVGFNIDDPEHPYAVSSLELQEKVRFWRIELTQHFLLITAPKKGLYIVDVKDPKKPQLLSHLHLDGVTQQIVVKGDLALVAAGNKGLHVIDIKNKKEPIILSTLDLDSYIQSIAYKNDLALLSGGKGNGPGVTYIIDISTPSQPRQVDKLTYPAKVWDSLVIDKRFYCGTSHGVFETDLTSPYKSKKVTEDIYVSRLFYKENKLYAVSRSQRIYQYQANPGLTYLKILHTPRHACQAIDILGHYAFIASGQFGMLAIDLNHQSKEITASTSLSIDSPWGRPYFFYEYNTYIGIVEPRKIYIIHRETPDIPYKTLETIDFSEQITAMFQKENKLYVAVKKYGIFILTLDKKNNYPLNPYLHCEKHIVSISIYNNKIYICTLEGNILVAKQDFESATPLKKEPFTKNTKIITVHNDYAFVVNSIEDIHIYDLKNQKEILIGSIKYPKRLNQSRTIHKLYIKDRILFICGRNGIISIDIEDIYKPKALDSIEFTSPCSSIQFKQNYAYINHNMDSFTLVDISNPSDLKKLCQLYYPTKNWVYKNKLFQINKSGDLTIESAPLALEPRGLNSEVHSFSLSEMAYEQAYDLYISDDQKVTKISNALFYSPQTGWQLTAKKKAALLSEGSL